MNDPWREIRRLTERFRDQASSIAIPVRVLDAVLADSDALLEAIGPDLAGRPFAQLLREAALWMRDAGGGPLADCLAGKWGSLEGLPEYLKEAADDQT